MGVTVALSYSDSRAFSDAASATGGGAPSAGAETSSTSLGTAAGIAWRYVWNPADRLEIGSFVQAGYRRQQSDSEASLSAAATAEPTRTVATATAQTAALSGGLNVDANMGDTVGLRVAVTLAEAAWSEQSASVSTDRAGPAPGESTSTSLSAGLKVTPSLGLRVRF